MPECLFNFSKEEILERYFIEYINTDEYEKHEPPQNIKDINLQISKKLLESIDKNKYLEIDDLIADSQTYFEEFGFKQGFMYAISLSKLWMY